MTGSSFKENDSSVQRLLNDWKKFYPLNQSQANSNQAKENVAPNGPSGSRQPTAANSVNPNSSSSFQMDLGDNKQQSSAATAVFPPVVEVIVAGVKMRYPSSYVYLTPDRHSQNQSSGFKGSEASPKKDGHVSTSDGTTANSNNNEYLNANTQIGNYSSAGPAGSNNKLKSPLISPRQPAIPSPSFRIRSKAQQDMIVAVDKNILSSPKKNRGDGDQMPASLSREELSPVSVSGWDFVDACCKVSCNCSRCKSSPKKGSATQVKSGPLSKTLKNADGSLKGGQNDKSGGGPNKTSPVKPNQPFHKRASACASLDPNFLIWEQPVVNNTSGADVTSSSTCNGIPNVGQPTTTNLPSVNSVASSSGCTPQPKTPCYTYKSPGASGSILHPASIQSIASTPGALDSPRSAGPTPGGLSSVSPHPASVSKNDQTDSQVGFCHVK